MNRYADNVLCLCVCLFGLIRGHHEKSECASGGQTGKYGQIFADDLETTTAESKRFNYAYGNLIVI